MDEGLWKMIYDGHVAASQPRTAFRPLELEVPIRLVPGKQIGTTTTTTTTITTTPPSPTPPPSVLSYHHHHRNL
jgi:hypothetical protein